MGVVLQPLAKRFIKSTKPFVRKQLREGNFALVFNGKEFFIGEKIKMGIGFRFDEMERASRLTTSFKGIVGKRGVRNKWETIEWREGYFPLIEDKINHFHVKQWADKSGLIFPLDSNCVGCFHKPIQQLRKNFDTEKEKMEWFANQESESKRWKKEMNYNQIKKVGLQEDFIFGTGSGCQAGFCTD